VATDPHYGSLSRRSLEDMQAGARVEVAPYKRSPMDFVLWKPSTPEQPGWDSPWGRGRPGWHIECSAMAEKLLGREFDIHGGGIDLAFPHHENELAQSRCAHPDHGFASIWMHNGFLQVEGEKMSKSLGNFFTVKDLRDKGIPGEVIRFVLLSAQYRQPIDWTERAVEEAMTVLRRWRDTVAGVEAVAPSDAVIAALADDLNTPKAIAELHSLAKTDPPALKASAALLGLLQDDLGDWAVGPDLSAQAAHLSSLRAKAMETKDFSAVDAFKSALLSAGVEVRMSKTGVELKAGSGFDAVKVPEVSQ
jgi:cysteinyl-tRNA synthetase